MKKEKNIEVYNVSDEDKNTLFEKTDTRIWLWANYILMFFIFLSIILVFVDTIPGFIEKHLLFVFVTDYIISIVFLLEYIYRWKNSSNKFKFPFRTLNIFDFLSFWPILLFLMLHGIWQYQTLYLFRIFRIFRLFKILELMKRIPIVMKLIRWINKYKIEYIVTMLVIFIILICCSAVIYLLEFNYWDAESFSSLPITLWWWIVTITTVWYGDMIPITVLWKIISTILMFLWPVLITVLSSITVVIFLESAKMVNITGKHTPCKKCLTSNDQDSKFCKNCGWSLL